MKRRYPSTRFIYKVFILEMVILCVGVLLFGVTERISIAEQRSLFLPIVLEDKEYVKVFKNHRSKVFQYDARKKQLIEARHLAEGRGWVKVNQE